MAQQLSLALGVTIGGFALSTADRLSGAGAEAPTNFTFAFLTVGLISLASVLQMRRLAPEAGAEVSGRAVAGREVTEPKVEARPQA